MNCQAVLSFVRLSMPDDKTLHWFNIIFLGTSDHACIGQYTAYILHNLYRYV